MVSNDTEQDPSSLYSPLPPSLHPRPQFPVISLILSLFFAVCLALVKARRRSPLAVAAVTSCGGAPPPHLLLPLPLTPPKPPFSRQNGNGSEEDDGGDPDNIHDGGGRGRGVDGWSEEGGRWDGGE